MVRDGFEPDAFPEILRLPISRTYERNAEKGTMEFARARLKPGAYHQKGGQRFPGAEVFCPTISAPGHSLRTTYP
jgi:hypothetical protein